MAGETLRVLMVCPEAVPFAKTGGLADVAGALPEALAQLGCDVRCVMPRYRQVDVQEFGLRRTDIALSQSFAGEPMACGVWTVERNAVAWYFIDAPQFFDREQLYAVSGEDYPDNFERFTFFAQQALALTRKLDWRPDVIHCHDWQTSLVPVYLKIPVTTDALDTTEPFYRGIRTLFTIHNIAYQGLFPKEKLPLTGIGWEHYTVERLEYWDKLNFLKAGLVYSDRLSTVSKRYSEEIQSSNEFGRGMEGVLGWRSKDLTGILNGIDTADWNPETDHHLPKRYGVSDLRGKQTCKRMLLREMGMEEKAGTPLVGIISRLDDQKGFDLIEAAFDDIMALGVDVVVLGTGTPKYHEMLERMAKSYVGRVAVNLTFDNALAHRIEGGADLFLMPSKFEPGGLNQLYSLRYGTIPVVHATGGLYDTVSEYAATTETGNGFSFSPYSAEALVQALRRAVSLFPDRPRWRRLMRHTMMQDFSWNASAQEYLALYRDMVGQAA